MNETTTRLLTKFQNEDYRYAYDEEFSSARMAMQIQAIRESQEMTQKDLAELAEMRQSRISELENVNYSMWTVSTLRRIARSLGVRFSFRFESWSELLPEIENNNREHLVRPRFEKDETFTTETKVDKIPAKASGRVLTSPKFATEPVIHASPHTHTLPLLIGVESSTDATTVPQKFRDAQLWKKESDSEFRQIPNMRPTEAAIAA